MSEEKELYKEQQVPDLTFEEILAQYRTQGQELYNPRIVGGSMRIGLNFSVSTDGDLIARSGTFGSWTISGNSFATTNSNILIGTGAGVALTTGENNTCIGYQTGTLLTEASYNLFFGYQAGKNSIPTSLYNTAIGYQAGFDTAGAQNLYVGFQAGYKVTGNWNVFIGSQAGSNDTNAYYNQGNSNVCVGLSSGTFLMNGSYNVFAGYQSGYLSQTASYGVCLGYQAGYSNVTGNYDIFIGHTAGYSNESGTYNIAIGNGALTRNVSGNYNVAIGFVSGIYLFNGQENVAVGPSSLGANNGAVNTTGSNNTCIGASSGSFLTTGGSNTFLGSASGTYNSTGSYNTYIGRWVGGAIATNYSSSIGIGYYTLITASNQLVIGSDNANGSITDAYFGQGVTKASPAGITFNPTGGSGTNNVGADLIIAGGKSTGNATPGKIIFKNSVAGVSGTTLQSLGFGGVLDFTSIATSDKTFTFPNATGTIALTSDLSSYQPLDADLTAIAALSSADSNFIVGSAGGWVVESGATVRTSLGLGTGDSPTFAGLIINQSDATVFSATAVDHYSGEFNNTSATAGAFSSLLLSSLWSDGTYGAVLLNAVSSASYSNDLVIQTRNAGNYQESMRISYNGIISFPKNSYSTASFNLANQGIPYNTEVKIALNSADVDNQSELNVSIKSGTATSTSANHLVDTNASFVAGDVGRWVWNSTDDTYATITVVNSGTDVTLSADIMVSGESYKAYFSKCTVKAAGEYDIFVKALFLSTKIGTYVAEIYKNGSKVDESTFLCGSDAGYNMTIFSKKRLTLAANDYIEFYVWHNASDGLKKSVYASSAATFMQVIKAS